MSEQIALSYVKLKCFRDLGKVHRLVKAVVPEEFS